MNTQLGISSTARRKTVYSVIAGSILFLLSFILIPETLPDSSSAEAGVVPTPSLTFSGSHAISLTVNPGQFGTSDTQNLVVETTNYTGYTMSIAPSTGNSTDLVNTAVNTYTIPSIASTTTLSSFQALSTAAYGLSTDNGTTYLPITNGGELYSTNGATDSTTGGMTIKLGAKAISSTPSGDYTKAFTLTATANAALYSIIFDANAGEDTVTNMPTGATLSGAEVVLPFSPTPTRAGYLFLGWDTNQNATTPAYTDGGTIRLPIDPELDQSANTRKLYAIWGCGDGYICYDDNGADEVGGGKGSMKPGLLQSSAYAAGAEAVLVASNYSKTGYGFVGWSTTPVDPVVTNDHTIADIKSQIASLYTNGQIYGPNETITMPDPQGPKQLYAVWLPAEKDNNDNPIYLQGWMGCQTTLTNTGDVIALTDSRDNDVYTVAKLADGNCWMIENLRLDYDANITPANTQSKGAFGGVFAGLAEPESANFSNSTTANSLYTTDASSTNLRIIEGNSGAYRFPRYNNINTASRATTITSVNANIYSYGNYYTWSAAIADTTYYSTYNQSVANTSLCPSGWHLPKGGSKANETNNEWWGLVVDGIMNGTKPANYSSSSTPFYTGASEGADVSKAIRAYPTNLVYSAGFSNSSPSSGRGVSATYWSSTAAYYDDAFINYLSGTNVQPMTISSKYSGYAVRCLASTSERFTLTYNANGGDPTSVPQAQNVDANGNYTFTISSTIPTRTGYTFAGWMDEEGNEIASGGSYIVYNTSATIYARWTNNDCNSHAATIGTGNSTTDAVCLQDINSTVRSNMIDKQTYTLKDARDNQSYTISKLDDGNVWMTQNLNYGSSSDTLLTSYDTDLLPGSAFRAPASTTTFEDTDDATTRVSPKILTDNTYGGYYSFAAAIADTTAHTTGQNVITSICPVGWDLPSSAQYDSLKAIANLTDYNTAHAAPYNFTYAGYRSGTGFISQTSTIRLWTSSNTDYRYAYYGVGYTNSRNDYNYKRYGESVRCIVANGTASVKYYKNDGTSDFVSQNNININSDRLYPSSTFSRGDTYAFKGWDTAAAGDGIRYDFNADISTTGVQDGQTLELYAVWNPKLKVVFHANYESTISIQWIEAGTSGTLGGYNKFTRSGYKIVRWDTDQYGEGTSYATSSSYTAPANTQAGDELHLYAIWEQTNTVIYNANSGDCGNGTATCMQNVKHTNVVTGDTFDLFASNYSRTGYGFAGWSTEQLNPDSGTFATDLAAAKTAGLVYGPNETIEATSAFISKADSNKNITLYAIWIAPEQGVTMQTFDPSATAYNDTNKPIGSVIALSDARDTNVYAVAKLADGNWWMIENLRLEAANSRSTDNIAKAQGYASGFTGLADAETANFTTSTTANSLYSTSIEANKNQITGGNSSYYHARFPRYNNYNTTQPGTANYRATNPSATNNVISTSHTDFSASIYSYGNYYTWAAAIADTQQHNTSYEVVTSTSLCPTDWHLPYGGSGTGTYGGKTPGGFSYLDTQLQSPDGSHGDGSYQGTNKASQRWRAYPNNFVYNGTYSGSTVSRRGSYGYYWSNTANSDVYAYGLDFRNTFVDPGTDGDLQKYGGRSVRCVASNYYTLTVNYSTGVSGVAIDGNTIADGASITLMEGTDHTISMTLSSGYEFDNWSVSGATVGSTSAQSTTLTMNNSNAVLTVNANLIPYSVIYNANGGRCENTGTVTDTCMQNLKYTNVSQGDSLNLYASNYSRAGYGYAGWSTEQLDPDSSTFTQDLATARTAGLVYGPNETIEATSAFISKADSNKNITLYAIWIAPEQGITMQTFDPATSPYSSMANGSIIALSDARDTNVYTVAKLADGKWWMIENLRLDNTASHNSDGSLAQGYASGFIGLADSESTNFSDSTTANTLYSTTNITGSNQSSRFPRYNNRNTASRTTNQTGGDANIYSYGNYYTWAAAVADTTNTYSTVNQSVTSTSLCPSGWHLPTGGTKTNITNGNSEWWTLTYAVVGSNPANYNSQDRPYYTNNSNAEGTNASKALRAYPNNLVYSGRFNGSSASSRGTSGYYWSSTANGSGYSYYMLLSSNSIYPATADSARYRGQPVRCVSDAAASNNSNNNSNNNNSQQNSQQQSAEPQASPQATPSAAPSAQSMSLSAPANAEPTDAEDQAEEEEDSKATSTAPLGVRKSSDDKTNTSETVASVSSGSVDESDAFGLIALVGAGVATTSGLLLLAGKRRKDDEEDEPEA